MREKTIIEMVADYDWNCPKCGKHIPYGSRRTLWSLLPFVCQHAHLDWSIRGTLEELNGSDDELYFEEVVTTDPVLPIQEHAPAGYTAWKETQSPHSRLKHALRLRLSDEIKGIRRHWWGPKEPSRVPDGWPNY
jgi:hypothetical protein